MIVIADTSPINYLIWMEQIDVLPKLYGRILIPASVHDELSDEDAPDPVRRWIAQPPSWLEVRKPSLSADPELISADLDQGETDAILPAQELHADELIIDDMPGRKEAERRHLHFIGTLGILQAAAKEGLLDFHAALASSTGERRSQGRSRCVP
jgi:predicted nucleic acid-binding protein